MIQKLDEHEHARPYRIQLNLLRVDPLVGWILGLLQHIEIVDSPAFKAEFMRFYEKNVASQIGLKFL